MQQRRGYAKKIVMINNHQEEEKLFPVTDCISYTSQQHLIHLISCNITESYPYSDDQNSGLTEKGWWYIPGMLNRDDDIVLITLSITNCISIYSFQCTISYDPINLTRLTNDDVLTSKVLEELKTSTNSIPEIREIASYVIVPTQRIQKNLYSEIVHHIKFWANNKRRRVENDHIVGENNCQIDDSDDKIIINGVCPLLLTDCLVAKLFK